MSGQDAPPHPIPARRSRWRILLRYAVISLLVVGAVLFFVRRQIGDLLARKLDERLAAAGIFVTWKSADWVPGPGIRLHGLALYRDAMKHDRIALFDNITAIKGHAGWNRWETVHAQIADARLTLSSGAAETNLEHLDMHLLIQPGNADLQDFHASLRGLRIEAKGIYLNTVAAVPAGQADAKHPAAQNKGVFDDVNLEWLHSVKEWLTFQPQKDEPVLRVEFNSLPDGGGMDVAATLTGNNFNWRGQKWDFVKAAIKTSVGDKVSPIEIEKVNLGQAGQTGEMEGVLDPARSVLRINKLDSGLNVLALTRAFVPGAAASLTAFATTGEWRISGKGVFPIDRPVNSQWKGSVALNGDFVYVNGLTLLALKNPTFTLSVGEQRVSLSGFKANLWDGKLDSPLTQIRLSEAGTEPRFETQLTLEGAQLQSVMDSFGTAQKQPGVVHLNWKGGGGFNLATISGSGALSIHNAEFFRIPLLGPLHLVFDRITPGFGRDVASSLTTNHRIGGGIFYITNLKLESKLTRIEGNGTIDLSRQYAWLDAKAKLQGIAGLATALLSALLEVEGEGPTSDVKWKLKNAGLIGEAAGLVGKTGGAVIEGAGGALKATTGTATEAVKDTGKAAKGLLKLPGKLLGK
ncbi:MAG: AsmA-like C-terminal region-containing protein [Verrucomicrobia bacterium]|nr:AsmA-like C-terminal region-containing protein [Verrucomicrobiota bacterium]